MAMKDGMGTMTGDEWRRCITYCWLAEEHKLGSLELIGALDAPEWIAAGGVLHVTRINGTAFQSARAVLRGNAFAGV